MSKANLLIIDDDKDVIEVVSELFENSTENIYTANDGDEAFHLLNTKVIHCAICDINMPGMSGIDVIKRVNEDKIKIPIVFFSAHGNTEKMLEIAKSGAFDFVEKPNFKQLKDIVMTGLRKGMELV